MKNHLARKGILGLACLGLLAGASLVAPQTVPTVAPPVAEAATQAKAAKPLKGIKVGSQHVGSYKVYLSATSTKWEEGYCYQPRAGHPTSTGQAASKSVLEGMTGAQSADVMYAVQRYGGPDATNTTAAALVLYIWTVQDEPGFRTSLARLKASPQLKGAVAASKRIAVEAKNRGKFAGSGKVAAGYYGQTVDLTFHLVTAYNKGAYGKRLTLKGSGVKAPKSVTTGSDGYAHAKVKVTTTGVYSVTATHVSPASGAVLVNKPSAGHQKTVMHTGATTKIVLKASARAKKTARPTFRNVCTTNCQGVAIIEAKKSNECGAAPLRAYATVGGRDTGKHVDIAACKTGTVTFTAADLAKVGIEVCYLDHLGGRCVTKRVVVGTSVAECPRWPEMVLSGTMGCKTCHFTAAASNPSKRTMVFWPTLDGKRGSSFTLKPGQSHGLSLDSTGKVNGLYFEAKNGSGKVIAKGQPGKPGTVYAFG